MKIALTIAGSDSGGGAGIQADLKTFAAHGVFGTSAITAITAQIEAVVDDLGADAVKTGMLATAAIVEAVAAAIRALELPQVVVDPVMVAKGGDALLDVDAVAAMKSELLPLAHVVTPNLPEAEVLADMPVRSVADMRRAAERIRHQGPRVVLVKGGHLDGAESIDIASVDGDTFEVRRARIVTRHTHGTGCTLASAIAANLARGVPEREAIEGAREYLDGAIRHAPGLGSGHGPLNHFWRAVY